MSFTMMVFFIFLPVVLVLYRLLPEKCRWLLLLAASYLFYSWHNLWLLGLILTTTAVSYFSAIAIEEAQTAKGRRQAVFLSAGVCLGILIVFKYLDFAVSSVLPLCGLLGITSSFQGFHLLLPMGISFYVFQTMSYTFDVYRGKTPAERHPGYYALFVVFFPQLVAGPIERPCDLIPQLKAPCPTSADDIYKGLRLFVRGYAKKLLVADCLAVFVDSAYDHVSSSGGAALFVGILLFAVQIYCDFSGYSDIARGCAGFLGIRLTENFRRPYMASSIRDFWHRWHISLTEWFTDYLYIPLGGSRKGRLLTCRNILITFLASGLWHGANWTFVFWGGLHGIYLVLESLLFQGNMKKKGKVRVLAGRTLTFLAVCFAWIFFRCATLEDAFMAVRLIFTDWRPEQMFSALSMNRIDMLVILLLLLLLPFIEKLPSFYQENAALKKSRISCHTALLYLLVSLATVICRCLVLSEHGSTAFIYFQF